MSRNKFIVLTILVIVTAILACNLQGTPVVINVPTQEPTIPMETQVAIALASTVAAQTALANVVVATQAVLTTNTPEFTFTPSLTPTLTYTLTPAVPMVSVSVNTNCRSGPTTAYDLLGIMMVGEQAEVVGSSTLTDTMIIKLPSDPSITCWLWAQNATVVGDISRLPVIPIPPTPTPVVSFDVAFSSMTACNLLTYYLNYKVTNTGAVTWESIQITATDQVTHQTRTLHEDIFRRVIVGCAYSSPSQNVEAGETVDAYAPNFNADPTGHSIEATIRLCSQDGLAGTCLEKTITFTP